MQGLVQDPGPLPGKPMNMIRVMIIDEHLEVRRALAARLADFPNIDVVATACNCKEGVERALKHLPDVVLVELKGKNKQQSESIKEMREVLTAHPPSVIVLTSYADDEERQAAFAAGVNRYLLKQIDTANLMAEIEEVAAEIGG